jgi:hypothetical protein
MNKRIVMMIVSPPAQDGNFSGLNLLDALRRFNAKERFYLVGHFLGNPDFTPDPKRLAELEEMTDLPSGTLVEAPNKFCAMDYHLDWLNGALELAFLNRTRGDRVGNRITGSQEDIDFLLAFDTHNQSNRYHIVLVEAKGVISFSNSQLDSKLKRLEDIFFVDGRQQRFQNLGVHLVLAAPKRPSENRLHRQPENWKHAFINLPMPEKIFKITRTDKADKPDRNQWSKWKIEERKFLQDSGNTQLS